MIIRARVPVVGAVLLCLASSGGVAADPDADLDTYAPFVKAYLYQQVIDVDGKQLTAAQFGSETLNGLLALGLQRCDASELVRAAIARDAAAHPTEYAARSLMAQSRAAPRKEEGVQRYQQELWQAFLGDSRYIKRLLEQIRGTASTEHVGETTLRELDRLRSAVATGLARLGQKEGCNARPLTILGTMPHEDPTLAAAVFDIVTEKPKMSTRELAAALRERNWLVRGAQ